jgi:hypothetical protein
MIPMARGPRKYLHFLHFLLAMQIASCLKHHPLTGEKMNSTLKAILAGGLPDKILHFLLAMQSASCLKQQHSCREEK